MQASNKWKEIHHCYFNSTPVNYVTALINQRISLLMEFFDYSPICDEPDTQEGSFQMIDRNLSLYENLSPLEYE